MDDTEKLLRQRIVTLENQLAATAANLQAAVQEAWKTHAELTHRKEADRVAAMGDLAYTAAVGEAGERYHAQFAYAHPLPATWRWSELWDVMIAAKARAVEIEEACPVCDKGRLLPLRLHVCDGCGLEMATDADATANVQAIKELRP